MSVGLTVPARPQANITVTEVLDQAREAEEAGAASIWFSQLPSGHDALVLAALAGQVTSRAEIGTSVVPIYPRHPLALAAAARTASEASGGRFTLGIGLGAKNFLEPVYGTPYPPPVRHLREYLTVLRALFAGEQVDFSGSTVEAHLSEPAPAAPISVIVAAMGPQALRVTGELADGTLPYLASPRALSNLIVPGIGPGKRVIAAVPAVVTSDVDAVREIAARELGFYGSIPSYQRVLKEGGVENAAELVLIGDEETVAAGVRRYFDAGATDVLLTQTALHTDEDRRRTWRLTGELNSSGS
ncbi:MULTISPECIES: TIGR03564 family F420-dependent LLM class oxidoreductase [Amycolatopsis]|uniref:TIGR03564 family F420-dependent LLM class oxidoreductase n=1 Tax=Amycolatopsis dendrobii TaxID=2760662 RepID=A0A7W3VZ39_9PSEU|nr:MULTISPECIES: TIGR03564 family F420-dependent LLM class oxidoreductase [Amycolatopsis]MBB1155800.1 TIGR03564 family F420-dependent LLM class oxidoreductase [Amycolatopsis dendrobii]UKD53003.1 TIGR03564 family F420-dependent LLM class oxidoreductase [Amycolatopsis sp. FU40]